VIKKNHRQGDGAQFDDEIGLRQLLDALLKGRYIIAAFVTLFAALAVVYTLLLTPIYRANGFVLIEGNAQNLSGLDGTPEIIASKASVAQELQFIKSHILVGNVVDELDLTTHISPIYFPLFGAALARRHSGVEPNAAFFGLDSFAWGGETFHLSYLKVPRKYLGQPLNLVVLDGLQFSLSHNGNKLLKGSVGEMALGLEGEIQILVDSLVARPGTRFEVKKSGRFDAMLNLKTTLSVSEKGKDTGIIEIALEGADRDYILEVVDSVTNNFYLQEALNNFRSQRDSVDLSLEAGAALDSLVQIEADISVMSIDEIAIYHRFTPEHPSYISLKRQQENLKQQRIKFRAKLSELSELSATQKKILHLTRNFEAHQAIFLALDNRRQELSILKARRLGNVRLMGEAVVLPNIVSPKRKLNAILGILLGGMLGVMIVLLRFGTRTATEVTAANNSDYQKLPTKTWANMADRKNLLTPEELDALMEIGSGSY
jgi:tyrosine-protein kinase Etk/Wzc